MTELKFDNIAANAAPDLTSTQSTQDVFIAHPEKQAKLCPPSTFPSVWSGVLLFRTKSTLHHKWQPRFFILDPVSNRISQLVGADPTSTFHDAVALQGAQISEITTKAGHPAILIISQENSSSASASSASVRWKIRSEDTQLHQSLLVQLRSLSIHASAPDTLSSAGDLSSPVPPSKVNAACWMEVLRPWIGDRKLSQVAIPGSHDAATHELDMSKRYIHCHKGPPGPLAAAFKKDAVQWSRAQNVPILKQLQNGSRYLDIRVIYTADNPSFAQSVPLFQTCHGLYSSSVADVLNDVRTFIQSHPFEIIFLDFPEFHEKESCVTRTHDMSAKAHAALLRLIAEALGPWLMPRSFGIRTLNEIWATPFRVISFYRHEAVQDTETWLWPRPEWLRSSWKNKNKIELLFAELDLEVVQNNPNGKTFWVLQCVLTPTANSTIKGHVMPKKCFSSLLAYSQVVNKYLLFYLATETWRKAKVNVVMVDHCENEEVIQAILRLNVLPVAAVL